MRSLLFVPADSPRKIAKSFGSSADALILDLEDAVAMERKPVARQAARQALQQPRQGKKVFIRINALDTGLALDDLAEVMPGRPDGIVLPKCGGGKDVEQLHQLLDGMEAALRLPVGGSRIIPVATETPGAVLNLGSYAGCSARLLGLMWGAEDLASALGASANRRAGRYRAPFDLARQLCLLAAAAAGVMPIDAVWTDTADLEGLRDEAEQARIDGFTGKALIHPLHCDVVHQAFMPSEAEQRRARAILEAVAAAPGAGVAVLDGRMIDRPHVIQAQRILALAGIAVGAGPSD